MMLPAARRLFLVALLALLVAAPFARAQTWTGLGADNKWTTLNNWDTAVPGTGNTATFSGAGNSNTNVSLSGGSQAIGTISFDTASAAAYNLGVLNSGDTFNFDSGGSISVTTTVANLETINAVVQTGGDLTITVQNSSVPASNLGLRLAGGVTLNGNLTLSGAGAITVDKPITGGGLVLADLRSGSLNLNAQSTYSGGTFFPDNTTGGQQPAIRLGVDTVGSPGAVVSGPLGTGEIRPQDGNPPVFQPVGGDRTIANDWTLDRGVFFGSIPSAPLVDTTPRNLTLTGTITLGTPGRTLTNNLPAGVALYFGSASVTSPMNLGSVMQIQAQTAVTGNAGSTAIINDPIHGAGGIQAQNSALVVMNNANNDYAGATTVTGTGGVGGTANPMLLINGAKTGTGNVNVNTRCNANLVCSNATATAISGVGILGGTGSIAGTVTNGGIIAPGAVAGTPGTLTLTGNLTDASTTTPVAAPSHWAIELNGAAADKLAVGGNINLAAVDNLDISGTGSGTSWVIATYAGTLTGTFDSVTAGYTVDYGTGSNSQITLNAAPVGLPGDFNSDGKVDAGDYATWRKNNGTNNALANDNGLGTPIGPAHYNLWRANFGKPPGSGSGLSGAAVPEPGSLLLLICSVSAALVTSGRGFVSGEVNTQMLPAVPRIFPGVARAN